MSKDGGADMAKLPQIGGLQYASLFWFVGETSFRGELPVTIGWSIERGPDSRSGAWRFGLHLPTVPQVPFKPMADVEDAYGVLHRVPSAVQNEANAHLERELADRLLVFLHRVLLGQRITLPALEDNFEPVDVALLWGPTLPKLVGRLCYSHFQRRKTVAVLEPDFIHTNPPKLPDPPKGVWREGPEEPYWEDRAVRRWVRQSGHKALLRDTHVRSFDLILPCADGVSGRLSGGEFCGSQLWQEKAQTVKDVLAGKVGNLETEFDLAASWAKVSLTLPRGVKRAFQAASCTVLL